MTFQCALNPHNGSHLELLLLQWNPLSPKTHYKKIQVTHDVFDGPANSLLCYAWCSSTLHEMPSPDA
jgi:hypothetical protein